MSSSFPTVTVQYVCHTCTKEWRDVGGVPARSDDEEVVAFVQRVSLACGNDHMEQHPECPTRKIDIRMKLPAGEDPRIGDPA